MAMKVGRQASYIFTTQEAAWAGGGTAVTQNLFPSHLLSPARPTSSRFCSLPKQYPTWRLRVQMGACGGHFMLSKYGRGFSLCLLSFFLFCGSRRQSRRSTELSEERPELIFVCVKIGSHHPGLAVLELII